MLPENTESGKGAGRRRYGKAVANQSELTPTFGDALLYGRKQVKWKGMEAINIYV